MEQTGEYTDQSTKAKAFRRIAAKRTVRILDSLRLLGQCSNRRSYEYTDDQITKVFNEIRHAVRDTEQRFRNNSKKVTFEL